MQCKLIQENKLTDRQSCFIKKQEFSLKHTVEGKIVTFLSDVKIEGYMSYAAISEVKNCFGVKSGYIIVIGEQ